MRTEGILKPTSRWRSPRLILAAICICWLAMALLATQLISTRSFHAAPKSSAASSPVTYENQFHISTQAIASEYMTALLKHQYSVMWPLLDPQVQAIWPNETAFASFWQARFQDYTLQGFVVGKPHLLAHWVNPETMVEYNSVAELPVSLSLQPGPALQQNSLLPPEDLHPSQLFQNLPFIVQHASDSTRSTTYWFVLDGGPADPEAPILPPLQSLASIVQVPILMYHHISDVPPKNLLDLSLTVTPTRFSQQLDYLKEHGYHTITFNQLFNALYYNGPLPLHPIILTFDDGYDDAYHFAFPLLRSHGFSGMFYIITGKIGWQGYMNRSQLREMLASGMQIGSHTVDHVNVGALVSLSVERAQLELQESQAVLEKNLGVAIQQFCYPSGEPFRSGTLLEQQEIVKLLAQDGYVGATTDPGRTGTWQNSQAPFALLRIRVDGRSSLQFFIQSLPWV